MFNFFRKTNEINKNVGNKEDCYLYKSKVLDQRILDDDKLEHYNDLLFDENVPVYFKDLIKYFLLPYKISILKFTFNKEYFEDPFPFDFEHNHQHIAPSLRVIKEDQFNIPMGYPSWFCAGFPDVAIWAMKGDGRELIFKRYENLPEEELIEGRYIKADIINDMIKLYQSNTNKPLECKLY